MFEAIKLIEIADPIYTEAFFGAALAAVSIGSAIFGGMKKKKAAKAQGKAAKAEAAAQKAQMEAQAKGLDKEAAQARKMGALHAGDIRKEGETFMSGMSQQYGLAGVDMAGSPLLALQDAAAGVAEDERRIMQQAEYDAKAMETQASDLRAGLSTVDKIASSRSKAANAEGSAAMWGGIAGAASTAASSGLFSGAGNAVKKIGTGMKNRYQYNNWSNRGGRV